MNVLRDKRPFSLWHFKKCNIKGNRGRHKYILFGFCPCGQMSRKEYDKIKNETRKEIERYERTQQAEQRAGWL
jgi:hypothetical protein